MEGKSFQIALATSDNDSYLINFTLVNCLEIKANQINNIINKLFLGKFTYHEIRENKYFLQFDSLNEIFDELNERIKSNNKIIIRENENKLIIHVPLPSSKYKELIFNLKLINKNDNQKMDDLMKIIIKQNNEIQDLKNEINNLKKN